MKLSCCAFVLASTLLLGCSLNEGTRFIYTEPTAANTGRPIKTYKLATGASCSDFGQGGKLTLDFNGGSDTIASMYTYPDGRLLALGKITRSDSSLAIGLARFESNGNPDFSFGSNGIATLNLGIESVPASFSVYPNGDILIGGHIKYGSFFELAVIRLHSDGSYDSSFGTNGVFTHTENPSIHHFGGFVQVAPNGSIFHTGRRGNTLYLMKLTAQGAIDTSFASNGLYTYPSFGYYFPGLMLQPDGKIVMPIHKNQSHYHAIRLLADGSPDPSFGTSGNGQVGHAGVDVFTRSAFLQPDGKIVLVAYGRRPEPGATSYTVSLARLNTDGSLDMSFGSGGKAYGPSAVSSFGGFSSERLPNGSMIVIGSSLESSKAPGHRSITTFRFDASGNIDLSFNGSGYRVESITAYDDRGAAIISGADGKIYAGGFTRNDSPADQDWAILCYE